MTEKLTVTLKENKEYDAAWIVVHAESASEANAILQEIEQSADFLSTVGRVKAKFGSGAFQVGQHLGGESLTPHQNSEQLAATAPPTPPQQNSQQSQTPPPSYTAPTPVGAQPPSSGTPEGPFIPALGMNATYKEGQNARGPWRAFFDPRPFQSVKGITQSTDDVNHPGLAAGTHKYASFIR